MLYREADYTVPLGPKEVVKPLPEVALGYFGRRADPAHSGGGCGLPCGPVWLPPSP